MNKEDKIVAARMRLRERFLKTGSDVGLARDDQGSGPPNRHGKPKLPVGQVQAKNWPILDLGIKPTINRDTWRLELSGACDKPLTLDWQLLLTLEQVEEESDFHCVTTWSRMDISFKGVRFIDVAAMCHVHETATHIMCHASDGYSTNLSLAEALKPDVLLVYQADGSPLERDHGGPVRMITPQLYAWKGAKWISAIEFLTEDKLGYWEKRGYSNTARPWENDRYR